MRSAGSPREPIPCARCRLQHAHGPISRVSRDSAIPPTSSPSSRVTMERLTISCPSSTTSWEFPRAPPSPARIRTGRALNTTALVQAGPPSNSQGSIHGGGEASPLLRRRVGGDAIRRLVDQAPAPQHQVRRGQPARTHQATPRGSQRRCSPPRPRPSSPSSLRSANFSERLPRLAQVVWSLGAPARLTQKEAAEAPQSGTPEQSAETRRRSAGMARPPESQVRIRTASRSR